MLENKQKKKKKKLKKLFASTERKMKETEWNVKKALTISNINCHKLAPHASDHTPAS